MNDYQLETEDNTIEIPFSLLQSLLTGLKSILENLDRKKGFIEIGDFLYDYYRLDLGKENKLLYDKCLKANVRFSDITIRRAIGENADQSKYELLDLICYVCTKKQLADILINDCPAQSYKKYPVKIPQYAKDEIRYFVSLKLQNDILDQEVEPNKPEEGQQSTNNEVNEKESGERDDIVDNLPKEDDSHQSPTTVAERAVVLDRIPDQKIVEIHITQNKSSEKNPIADAGLVEKENPNLILPANNKKRYPYSLPVGAFLFVLAVIVMLLFHFKNKTDTISPQDTLHVNSVPVVSKTVKSIVPLNQPLIIQKGFGKKATIIFSLIDNVYQTANASNILFKTGYDTVLGYVGMTYRDLLLRFSIDGEDVKLDLSWGYDNELKASRYKADEYRSIASDSIVNLTADIIHNLLQDVLKGTSKIDGHIWGYADSTIVVDQKYKGDLGLIDNEGYEIENDQLEEYGTVSINENFNRLDNDLIALLRAYQMKKALLDVVANLGLKIIEKNAISMSIKTVGGCNPAQRRVEMKLNFNKH